MEGPITQEALTEQAGPVPEYRHSRLTFRLTEPIGRLVGSANIEEEVKEHMQMFGDYGWDLVSASAHPFVITPDSGISNVNTVGAWVRYAFFWRHD